MVVEVVVPVVANLVVVDTGMVVLAVAAETVTHTRYLDALAFKVLVVAVEAAGLLSVIHQYFHQQMAMRALTVMEQLQVIPVIQALLVTTAATVMEQIQVLPVMQALLVTQAIPVTVPVMAVQETRVHQVTQVLQVLLQQYLV